METGVAAQSNVDYRRNVFKTLSIKPAKVGLRYVAAHTQRTNVFHAAIGLSTEVGELLQVSSRFLLEGKYTEDESEALFEELGDIGYYLAVMAKALKVPMPASTKKLRLVGTKGQALLALNSCATDLLSQAKKYLYGVKTHPRDADNPKIQVIDHSAQAAVDASRYDLMATRLKAALNIYWGMCYDFTGMPPTAVFAGNIAKLSERYGAATFTSEKALLPHDAKAQQKAALKAATAAVASSK